MKEWRCVFAAPYHEKTGRWKQGQFEWHVFSFDHARSLNGSRAIEIYGKQRVTGCYVIPESESFDAYQLWFDYADATCPEFTELQSDLYVWPFDLAWTMAFTHEEQSGLGPYFSRREWILGSNG
jgi:hypothetical protein